MGFSCSQFFQVRSGLDDIHKQRLPRWRPEYHPHITLHVLERLDSDLFCPCSTDVAELAQRMYSLRAVAYHTSLFVAHLAEEVHNSGEHNEQDTTSRSQSQHLG
jgi:hypothetical protein